MQAIFPGPERFIPMSMFIAIPTVHRAAWFGHNLCSLSSAYPETKTQGLGTLSKTLGLKCFGPTRLYGATQWDSSSLHIHLKYGPLKLVTAWTPAHTHVATLTYRMDLSHDVLLHSLQDSAGKRGPEPSEWVLPQDHLRYQEIQRAIEARSAAFMIPSRPAVKRDKLMNPILQYAPKSFDDDGTGELALGS